MQAFRPGTFKIALFCLVPFVYMGLFINSYTDDAFITLSYVKTLVTSHTWGMYAGHVSNAATSPLHVILLSAVALIVRDPEVALYLFNVGVVFATWFVLRRIARNMAAPQAWPLIATALLYVNPLLISTLGLESYLYLLILLLTCMLYAEDRYWLTGVACGLLYLTRPDGCLAAGLLVAACLLQRKWRGLVLVLPVAVVGLGWSWVSWRYLGSPIPDTFFIKQGQMFAKGYYFFAGLFLYFSRLSTVLILSFLPVVALPWCRTQTWNTFGKTVGLLLMAYVLAHFVGYSVLKVPPYHWYYSPEAAFCVLAGSLGMACRVGSQRSGGIPLVAVQVLGGLIIVLMAVLLTRTLPISTNWANKYAYREVAEWLNRNIPDDKIALGGELGILQYYTRADIIDEFSDRQFMVRMAQESSSPLSRQFVQTAFQHAQVPGLGDIHFGLTSCPNAQHAVHMWAIASPWKGASHMCLFRLASVKSGSWTLIPSSEMDPDRAVLPR